MVHLAGFEPARHKPLVPETSVSTNSTTDALVLGTGFEPVDAALRGRCVDRFTSRAK